MPNLKDVLREREVGRFKKKNYRPWNLSGDLLQKENLISNSLEENAQKENYINENDGLKNSIPNKEKDKITTLNVSPEKNFLKLSGIQKRIVQIIYKICLAKGTNETGPLETKFLSSCSNSSEGSFKVSINRLVKKGIIQRKKGKTAKGGFVRFAINTKVKTLIEESEKASEIDKNELLLEFTDKKNKVGEGKENFDKKKAERSNIELPDEWKTVDISPIECIGFSKNHLTQLINFTKPEIVQESINRFAFSLSNNPKTQNYSDPINVLMGILRKGHVWNEPNYKSPQEIAQEQLIIEMAAQHDRHIQLQKEAYELAFNHWRQELNHEDISKIKMESGKKAEYFSADTTVSMYFNEKIWPKIQKKYITFNLSEK